MRTQVQNHTIPLNTKLPWLIPGRFFILMETSEPVNVYFIKASTVTGQALGIEAPFSIGPVEGVGFDGIHIETVSGAVHTVKMGIGTDPMDYQRLAGGVSVSRGNVIANDTVTVDATVGGTLIAAANSGRAGLTIANTHATEILYLGASGVTVANGFPVGPGATAEITRAPEAALYGIRSGADIDVRKFEEKD